MKNVIVLFFHVSDLYLNFRAKDELNKDLRASLIFQQGEFNTGVSSLGMNGTSVSRVWKSMGSSNYFKRSN